MKRTITLLILMLACTHFVFPDSEWLTAGTKWHYSFREDPFGSAATGYKLLEITRDTTIDGQHCWVMESTLFTTDGKVHTGYHKEYLYYSDSILYRYQKDRFDVLYDFTAAANDTFYIRIYSQWEDVDTLVGVRVDSVSTVTIDGVELRKYFYNLLTGNEHPINAWVFHGEVIERVGNLSYFFPYNQLDCDAAGCSEPLRCYQDEFIYYQGGYWACDELYSSADGSMMDDYEFTIYPNPTTTTLHVTLHLPNGQEGTLRLINGLGQMVKTLRVNGSGTTAIDVSGLPKGYYYIQTISDSNVLSKCFIKR